MAVLPAGHAHICGQTDGHDERKVTDAFPE